MPQEVPSDVIGMAIIIIRVFARSFPKFHGAASQFAEQNMA